MLRSLSFNTKVLTEKELNLFSYLVENPDYKCDVAYDIIHAAFEGRINYNEEFNIVGYEYTIKRNERLGTNTKGSRETSLEAPLNCGEDSSSLSDLIPAPDSEFDEMVLNNSYKDAVNYIKSIGYYVSHDGSQMVDLAYCILQALRGIPNAVETLKYICSDDKNIQDNLEIILSHGIDSSFKNYLKGVV